jgi:hypothetical protein
LDTLAEGCSEVEGVAAMAVSEEGKEMGGGGGGGGHRSIAILFLYMFNPGCAMATTESLYYWNCALNLGDRDEEELPSRLVQLSRSSPPNIHVRAVPTAPPHSTGGEG